MNLFALAMSRGCGFAVRSSLAPHWPRAEALLHLASTLQVQVFLLQPELHFGFRALRGWHRQVFYREG